MPEHYGAALAWIGSEERRQVDIPLPWSGSTTVTSSSPGSPLPSSTEPRLPATTTGQISSLFLGNSILTARGWDFDLVTHWHLMLSADGR